MWWHMPVNPAIWEAEAAVSWDHTTALQPGWQSETFFQEIKKIFKKVKCPSIASGGHKATHERMQKDGSREQTTADLGLSNTQRWKARLVPRVLSMYSLSHVSVGSGPCSALLTISDQCKNTLEPVNHYRENEGAAWAPTIHCCL